MIFNTNGGHWRKPQPAAFHGALAPCQKTAAGTEGIACALRSNCFRNKKPSLIKKNLTGVGFGAIKKADRQFAKYILYIQGRFLSVRFRKNNFANGLYAKCAGFSVLTMTLKLRVCQQKTQYLRRKKRFFNRR
ncbi:MAG: hypothetical protein IKS15_02200 [Opitutales bacterium]|nr:hypothetical protein [Opitutales bacterium]